MSKLFRVLTLVVAGVLLVLWTSVDSTAYPDLDRETHRDYEGFERGQHPYPHHLIQGEGEPRPKPAKKKTHHHHDDAYVVDDDDLVWLRQTSPDRATLGEDYCVDIDLKALEDIADVEVRTAIPNGASYVGSDPNAVVEGDELVWRFDKMNEGEKKDLQACFKPNREGDFAYCTTAHAVPVACTVTTVGIPRLSIEKDGPDMVDLGDSVTYRVEVTNTGTATAHNVSLRDVIPRGMLYKDGDSEAMFDLGDLGPNESESLSISMKANERGDFCNYATASASNAADASDDACTRIVEPGIEVTKSGSAKQFIGKSVTYDITVRNSGDTDLSGVRVKDSVDSHTRIVDAVGADVSRHSATWDVGELDVGQSRGFNVEVESDSTGNFCDEVTASGGGVSDSDEACTEWIGHPAILVEVIDTEDPLIEGEESTYIIKVTNQGHAADYNVTVNATLPRQLKPLSVSGDTDGSISANRVSFDAYSTLEPKETIEYQIRVEAASIGDGRLMLEVDSDLLKSPVKEEESTHVY